MYTYRLISTVLVLNFCSLACCFNTTLICPSNPMSRGQPLRFICSMPDPNCRGEGNPRKTVLWIKELYSARGDLLNGTDYILAENYSCQNGVITTAFSVSVPDNVTNVLVQCASRHGSSVSYDHYSKACLNFMLPRIVPNRTTTQLQGVATSANTDPLQTTSTTQTTSATQSVSSTQLPVGNTSASAKVNGCFNLILILLALII